MQAIRKRLTYANVMSSIAVFLVIGGGAAFAATNLAKNSVGTRELKPNAVKTGILARNAVRTGKLSFEAVKAGKLAQNAVPTNRLRDAAVTTDKIGDKAVTTDKIGDKAVTTDKLAAESVTETKIAAKAVTQAKLADNSVGSVQLKGITVVSATTAKTANGVSTGVTATCPSGEEVVSGGFETESTGADKWVVKRLLRLGNGWRVFGVNESGGESSITAFAYCLAG